MKKIIQLLSNAKLNQKITLFISILLAIPVIIFSMIIFGFLQKGQIRSKVEDIKLNMVKSQSTIQKNVELCNMSTQVFLNTESLIRFISELKEGKKFDGTELVSFYKNDIRGLEKIVNSNPYLYQIRVYVDTEAKIEMMPILYHYDRLHNLEWFNQKPVQSGNWQFDYEDTIFPEYVTSPTSHIVSLVTSVKDYNQKEIGIIEVATKMEILFPDLYTSTDENWSCFVDHQGKIYYDTTMSGKWEPEVKALLDKAIQEGDSYYRPMKIKGEEVIVACEYIKTLNGYFMKIVSIEDNDFNMSKIRNLFIGSLLLGIGLASILIRHSVKTLLKRLYEIMKAVNLIGKGNMTIRVPSSGNDEVGDLGKQINVMLENMANLMEQGIQKERLIKDTQIKALQNQINAHFIYNVLESIKMMAEISEHYAISDALTSLGKLLRYTMKWNNPLVTVEEEIEYIKDYLALINLRFDYRIILSINLSQALYKQQIPKMSLQPIVENAIYHGIEELAEDATIYIKSIVQGEDCLIEIMDSGVGMTEEQVTQLELKIAGEVTHATESGNGLGLKNVQDRISMNFGKPYGIHIVSKEKCYTKVIVKIPYKRYRGGTI